MAKKQNIALFIIMILIVFLAEKSFASINLGKGDRGSEPAYHSFEDLRDYLRDREHFYFQNADKPAKALVSLGYLMTYPTCAPANLKIVSSFKIAPVVYRIDNSRIYCNWREGQKTPFDWKKYRMDLRVGDLVFTRGDDKMNNLAKFFSNWTHVAIVTDPAKNKIFDATFDDGVQEHSVSDKWEGFGYYTCKRICGMPEDEKYRAIQIGINKYKNLPYLPKIESAVDVFTFVYKWCDKNDTSSMYCSKLVFNVFKSNMLIDTRRTSVDSCSRLRDTAPGDYLFSWIGVSPDNIYYSPSLDWDFDSSNNLKDV